MTEIQRLVKIKILKELIKEYELLAKYNDNGTDYDRYCALDMAIKELEQKPRWIPVSEKLPEDYKTVIASVEHGYVCPEARYSKEEGWQWAYESGTDYWQEIECDVVAWMPLPEPYKAERSGEE